MVASQNVLILTSDTGGGHRSAANALENSLLSASTGKLLVQMSRVMEESHYFCRKAADLYNYILRDHQNLMKYYFWAINKLKPYESNLVYRSAMGYGVKLFEKVVPNVIVSVHPMTQHFFAYVLKKLNLQHRIPLLTVVTDPYHGFWEGWACNDVSQYYVASDSARRQLMDFGVDSGKILVAGMPVHSRFHPANPIEKQALRYELGLDPEKFTVFVNAGWVGGGNIPHIYEALIRGGYEQNLDIQTVFLAGQNTDLLRHAQAMSMDSPFPTRVMASTPHMEQLMRASDIMVSKPGGLTTFEALSCHLPMIADAVTPPMPQESQTARFLAESGAAITIRQPEHIVSVIQSLVDSPSRYQSLYSAVQAHGKPGASDRIARDVLRYLEPSATTHSR